MLSQGQSGPQTADDYGADCLSDGSALLQIITQNDLKENFVLLGALHVPVGPDGTEFGGIATGVPGQTLATDLGIFVQLAWYF